MTPREADKIIRAGKPVTVETPLDGPHVILFVSRDRWNVTSVDGGKFDRGDMKLVRCDGCNKPADLKDGLCALCAIEANLVHDCPGEAVPSHKMEAEVDKEEVLGMLRALSREQYENEEQGKIIVAIYTMYRGWMLKLQKEEVWETMKETVKEYCETAENAAVIAQRVADRAKMLDLTEPQYRHIKALENAMSSLREAEYQLRLAGESK